MQRTTNMMSLLVGFLWISRFSCNANCAREKRQNKDITNVTPELLSQKRDNNGFHWDELVHDEHFFGLCTLSLLQSTNFQPYLAFDIFIHPFIPKKEPDPSESPQDFSLKKWLQQSKTNPLIEIWLCQVMAGEWEKQFIVCFNLCSNNRSSLTIEFCVLLAQQ